MYKKYIEMYGMGEWYNYQLSKLTCSSLYHATVDGNAEMVTYSATYINVVYIITEGYVLRVMYGMGEWYISQLSKLTYSKYINEGYDPHHLPL